VQQARDLVEAAHRAQAELARFDQAKIDSYLLKRWPGQRLRESPRIAALAVEETGYGVPADKQERTGLPRKMSGIISRTCAQLAVVSETKMSSRWPVRAAWWPALFHPPILHPQQFSKF